MMHKNNSERSQREIFAKLRFLRVKSCENSPLSFANGETAS